MAPDPTNPPPVRAVRAVRRTPAETESRSSVGSFAKYVVKPEPRAPASKQN